MWPPGTPSDEDEAAPSGGFPFEAAEDAANRARRPLVKARVEQNTDRGQRAPELIARPDGSSGDRMHIDDGPHAHASAGPGLLAAPLVDFQTPQMPAQVPRDHVFPGGGPVGRPAPPTENSPRGSFYEPVGALNAADQQTRHQATRPFNVGSVSGQAGPFHGTVSRQRADPFLLATPRAGSSAHASQESAAPEGGPASDSALDSSILSATAFGRLPAKCPKENGCAGCMEALKGCQGMAPVEAYVVLKGAKATVHRADNNQLIEDSGCELSRHYGEHHERLHRIPCTKPDPLPGTNAKAEDGHKDAVGDWCPFTPPNPQQCLLCNPELQPNPRASKAGDHKYARGLLGNPANIRCHLSGAEHCGRNHLKCSKCELEVSTQANLVAHWKKKHTEEEGNAPARRSTSQSKRAFHEVDQPNDDQAAAEDHDGSEDTEWQPRKRKQARSEPAAHEAGPASGKRRALGPPAKTQAAKPGPLADLAANPAEFFALDGSFRADSPTPASGVAPQRVPGFAVQQQMELASAPEFNSSTFGNRVPGRVHVQFESQFLRNVSFGSPSARLGPNQIDYSLSYSVGIPGYEQQASAAAGADGLASPICETGHAIFDITDNTGATNNFRTFSSARPVLQGHNHLSADTFARFDAGPASAAGPSGATWEGWAVASGA
ncbi:hypothetical protein DFJ74DRAFT_84418 [Hyaloraphidium curvatum]|nr:hypothetical protein DFJ74DRAFT_84418 [Hyaloraphidium curvatum]